MDNEITAAWLEGIEEGASLLIGLLLLPLALLWRCIKLVKQLATDT
jgi:hypothetical protein